MPAITPVVVVTVGPVGLNVYVRPVAQLLTVPVPLAEHVGAVTLTVGVAGVVNCALMLNDVDEADVHVLDPVAVTV